VGRAGVRARVALGSAALAAAGCVSLAPLGDDWEDLERADRDARVVETLHDLFAFSVDGTGERLRDREVIAVDLSGVRYRSEAGESYLRWADVDSVAHQTLDELPARPESLELYLRPESPSIATVRDRRAPLLAATGLVRSYVRLEQRPRWSRARLIACLDYVRERRLVAGEGVAAVGSAAGAAPVASATAAGPDPAAGAGGQAAPDPEPRPDAAATPAGPGDPDADRLAAIEAKLKKLREWHEQGLIDDAEYEAKKRELLDGM